MIKRYCILMVIVICSLKGISQEVEHNKVLLRDTLLQKPPKEIYKNFPKFYKHTDTLGMRLAAEKLLEEAKRTDNPEYFIMGYHRLSDYYRTRYVLDTAAFIMDTAITYLERAPEFYNKKQLFLVNGHINRLLGRYEKSIENYLINLEWAKNNKDELLELTSKIEIAKIKGQVYNPKEAIEIFEESLALIDTTQNASIKEYYHALQVDLWTTIANKHIELGDYENALLYCHKLIEKGKKSNNNNITVNGIVGLCDIYSLTKEYDKALLNLKAFDDYGKLRNKAYYQPFVYLFYARVYYYTQAYEKVLEVLKKIDELQKERQFEFFLLQEKDILYAKTYQALGKVEASLKFFDKANKVYRNNAERKSRLSNNITLRYNLADFKKELDILSKRAATQQFWLKIMIGTLILCILITLVFIRYTRIRNKKRFKALLEELDISNQHKNSSGNTDIKTKMVLDGLENFEKNLFFLDANITQKKLAQKLRTNTAYLSKIINEEKQSSFSRYINMLRISYCLKQLKTDKKFRMYTIDAISKEVGFNSVSSFINAFKLQTNLTPSYFIRELKKNKK